MLWAVGGSAALVYWMLSLRDGVSWFRSGVKGLALVPLVTLAVVQDMPLLALALALCSLGDICLSRPGERAFLAGLISFALGHLVWIAVFVQLVGVDPGLLGSVPRGLAILFLAVHAVAMIRLLLPNAGALRPAVAVYIAIIIAMGLAALATPAPLIIAGGVLFMASDTLLGMQTFVLTAGSSPERAANALIWPLYWGAIALLTLGSLG